MKILRSSRTSTAGLISVVFIYIVLILLVLLFSTQILRDVTEGGSLTSTIFIGMSVLIPLVLLGLIVVNIVRLFRDRRSNKPGVRFKIRLILFFSFVSLLSSIPQGILSITFLDTTLNSWFSVRLESALEGGIHIALTHYNERVDNLRSFSNSRVFQSLLRDVEYRPDRMWGNIKEANRLVDSLQVFTDDEEQLFFGDSRGLLDDFETPYTRKGEVIKDSTENVSALRVFKTVVLEDREYDIVLSSFLPDNFDQEAGSLTKSLEVFKQLEEYNTIFRFVLIIFYSFFSIPIILLSILISFLLSDEIIKPIVHLEEATRKVSEGDLTTRILIRSRDELSALTGSFNTMVSELERSRKQILQTEKVTAWQEIAQRMAHEIKNPLTPIKLSAERIMKKYRNDAAGLEKILEPAVGSIIREVDKLNDLLVEFRDFARLPAPTLEPCVLKDLVHDITEAFHTSYPRVSFSYQQEEEIVVKGDRNQLDRVFHNLFTNAILAMKEDGDISIFATLVSKGNLDYARIQVEDTGPGIDPSLQDKIFNPYFTTRENGTGLGLAIVDRIINDHKGSIWFESEVGIGTTFYIDIPRGTLS